MVQRGENFGFTLQTCESLDVSGQRVGQNFDGEARFKLMSMAR
jgi:hypothetical protein